MPEKKDYLNNYLIGQLRKMGLDRKQSQVYLFLLEKGSANVMKIARELNLSRPTVYRILEDLQNKELAYEDQSGKRGRFSANSPDGFLGILRTQRRKVEEQEREFLRIISVLQTKYHLLSDANEIKICSKKVLLEDFSNTLSKNIYVLSFDKKLENYKKIEKIYPQIRKRLGEISVKEILANQNGTEPRFNYIERKNKKTGQTGLGATLVVCDKIFILEKNQSFCIENPQITEILKAVFEMMWR